MESPYFENPGQAPMLCNAGCSIVIYEWPVDLHNCSSLGSITFLQIRGTTHVLTAQTNLYKLQLFF